MFKESKIRIHPDTIATTDTGYQGLQKIHANTESPKKKSKKNPLTKEDKENEKLPNLQDPVEKIIDQTTLMGHEYCGLTA